MVPKIRCKVTCRAVEKTLVGVNPENPDGTRDYSKVIHEARYTAKMSAVSDGSAENKKFWEFTPSGQVEFQTIKLDVFEVGKSYYVDFTPAD